nr:immunoglobulin heavy chain junction region [Mus musculus]MBK4195725.1 immunoglobulin heavy chain junction region [Mus musculus]
CARRGPYYYGSSYEDFDYW